MYQAKVCVAALNESCSGPLAAFKIYSDKSAALYMGDDLYNIYIIAISQIEIGFRHDHYQLPTSSNHVSRIEIFLAYNMKVYSVR